MDTVNRRTALKVSALLGAGAFASRALMPVAAAAEQTPVATSGTPSGATATHYGPAVRQEASGRSIKRLARFFIPFAASARNAMALHALGNIQA